MKLFTKNTLYISIILCLCFCLLWPFFRSGFIETDDGDWMIIRLSAFYQSFREGQFPVRLLGRLNYSYGYPVANFLYPGFLYIGSFIHVLGIPFVETIKIILIGSVLIASIALFLWLKRFTTSVASLVGVLTFLLSPYLGFDLFRRGSVGEVLAIAMASMSLYAIESRKQHLFTLALSLLILSHNSVAIISMPFIFSYGLVRGRIHVFISTILALGITSFFWIPALIERRYVRFDTISVSDPFQYFSINSQWILITISHVIAAIVLLLNWKKETITHRFLIVSFVFLLFLSLPVTSVLWSVDSFTRLFQFPYRFLSLLILIGSLLTAITIDKLQKPFKQLFIVVCIVLLIPSLVNTYRNIKRTNQPETFYTTNEASTTVANEYMPRWVREFPSQRASSEIEFFSGKGVIKDAVITTNKVIANIETIEDSVIQINSIYYPGWGVFLNGVPVTITYDNPKGVVMFPVPKGQFRLITEFRETVPRFIATMISIVSGLLYVSAMLIPLSIKMKIRKEVVMLMHESPHERTKKVRKVFKK